jgi:hypothetical protein
MSDSDPNATEPVAPAAPPVGTLSTAALALTWQQRLGNLALDVARLPLKILLIGGSITLVGLMLQKGFGMPDLSGAAGFQVTDKNHDGLRLLVAVLIFAVGIATAGFLWWLSARFFGLIQGNKLDPVSLAALKELPMGLPEGTIRAVLALVVAVVGLPMLLFSDTVGTDKAIAGYINGIITGVFGFYFGTRTTGTPAQALDKIEKANTQALEQAKIAAQATGAAAKAQSEADNAKQQLDTAQIEAVDAKLQLNTAQGAAATSSAQLSRADEFNDKLSMAQRHLGLAKTVLDTFAPILPKGVLPANLGDIIDAAEGAVSAVQGVTGSTATADQLTALAKAVDSLTGSGTSPLGSLVSSAAPLLQSVLPKLIPGLGPVAGLATLIGLGVKMGSSQFQRWRARVLAAPLAQGLIEFGALSPELVHAALLNSPLLHAKLGAQPQGTVDNLLLDAVLRDDGQQRLLNAYGPSGTEAADLLTAADVESGLAEIRQALLALYGAGDIQETTLKQVKETLASSSHPELSNARVQALTAPQANALIDGVSGISLRADVPVEQGAAFDALVMLTDVARRDNIDLARAIAEVK